jgi:hypothetical protein
MTYLYKAVGWDSYGSLTVAVFHKKERAVAACKRVSKKGIKISLFKVYSGQPGFNRGIFVEEHLAHAIARRFFTVGYYINGKSVNPKTY